jgi:flagellar protein FlaG
MMNIQPLGTSVALKPEDRAVPAAEAASAAPAQQQGKTDAPAAPAPTREQVAQAVKHINQAMSVSNQTLEFSIDQDSKETIVKVVDQSTKEVVRQIPSVEALEIAKSLDKMMGLLISQKA